MSRTPTYPGGIDAILSQYEGRRDGFSYAPGEALPVPDVDLAALEHRLVANPKDDARYRPPFRSSFQRKCFALREELQGLSELVFLNGLLIAHLRKRDFPDHAPALFHRLWAEHGTHLLHHLDARWLVSAVTTFGDHGLTPVQRSTGLAMTALFGMMKLYESERLYSGRPPERPFTLEKVNSKLPLQMDAYSLTNGGLDVNLIGRLWQEAEQDPVIAPLAHHLLDLMIHDDTTLFRRLRIMRKRKLRQKEAKAAPRTTSPSNAAPAPPHHADLTAETLRWGLVSTIKAPLPQIARFAAHHIEMGADALHIFLDDPDADTAAFLARHPKITVTQCDETYWRAQRRDRMAAHQQRQAFNSTRTLQSVGPDLHWLGHIDVDEFLISETPLDQALARIAPHTCMVRIPPAEALAPETGPVQHLKLSHAQAKVPKAQLQEIYPTFGLHLHGGFLSHTAGKIFARAGIPDTRMGIHALKYHGQDVTNTVKPAGLYLAHFHAPSWDHFRAHLEFRRRQGSYSRVSERPEMGQAELFQFLAEEEGDEGLKAFFHEVCADTPELRQALDQRGMLLRHRFDFDGAVSRVFGQMP
jgi:hypothetical protein